MSSASNSRLLNAAQERAVTSDASTVAILAGPGSGKTHTLISRVVWLVKSVGYRPENVLVATFTVKAAREMRERIGNALGNDSERKIVLGTFHSIARRYLAAYGNRIGLDRKFGIADENDTRSVIARICKRSKLLVDPAGARAWISKQKAKGSEAYHIIQRQRLDKTPSLRDLQACYDEYQEHLKRSNLLDYDDLLVRCVDLLRHSPCCVSNIQSVLIDEYQDTNGVQYELMKLFAQKHKRITVVGDPDQSIYGWRSAEVKNLYRLIREFPGTAEVSLEENYRSSQHILDTSLLVIQQDAKRYRKLLKPSHGKGSRPVLRTLKNPHTEADWIVSEIKRALVMSGIMLSENDVAILLRSAALSRQIEAALGRDGVAYRMVGGKKFYDRTEIKLLIDYLRVVQQPENNDALRRVMNVPKRGIGDGTVNALLEEAETRSVSLWDLVGKHCRGEKMAKTKITKQAEQKISHDLIRLISTTRRKIEEATVGAPFGLVQTIQHLLESLKLRKYLQDKYPEEHEQRWANLQEFISLAADFVRDLDQAGDDALPEIRGVQQSHDMDVLPRFLANISLASDAQMGKPDQESKPLVTLSTIHAAKGLEWPIVFVPAAYNGSIPHIRANDNDEERRLLYVAMTRAQALLYMSYPLFAAGAEAQRNDLSPFVATVSYCFEKRGPCFDRPVLGEIAGILGRQLPSDQSTYKHVPADFYPEDNRFPIDPDEALKIHAAETGKNSRSTEASRPKRPRLGHHKNPEQSKDIAPWYQGYTTTMESSSSFTMTNPPGFVSATAHQASVVAAQASALSKKNSLIQQRGTKRAVGQTTLSNFIQMKPVPDLPNQSDGNGAPKASLPGTTSKIRKAMSTCVQPTSSDPYQPAIMPELAKHKLRTGTLARPTPIPREDGVVRKPYTAFSSSPTKPTTADTGQEERENEPPPSPTRPAATMHSTTVLQPTGLGSGFRRPARLTREGVTPLDRLRKPFRPLRINRP